MNKISWLNRIVIITVFAICGIWFFKNETDNSVIKAEGNSQISAELFSSDVGKSSTSDTSTNKEKINSRVDNLTREQKAAESSEEQGNNLSENLDSTDESEQIGSAMLPDFDWNILNTDGVNLSDYEQVKVNTPVRLTGGVYDTNEAGRDYFLFNGHITGLYNKKNFEMARGDVNSTWNMADNRNSPLLQPMLIAAPKDGGSILAYDFKSDLSSNYNSNAFDIGEMNSPEGPIELSQQVVDDSGNQMKTFGVAQYIKGNETIYYGYMVRAKSNSISNVQADLQPVRVRSRVVDTNEGRVRFDISFYNSSKDIKYYAATYGLHVDIAGAHDKSKLYSLGKDGIYFKQLVGKNNFDLYFYTDEYYGKTGGWGPTAYKTGELGVNGGVSFWNTLISLGRWTNPGSVANPTYTQPYLPWDSPGTIGEQYVLKHPGFALRWDPVTVKSGEVGSIDMDVSVKETENITPAAEKTFKNMTSNSGLNNVGDTLLFDLSVFHTSDRGSWKNIIISDQIPANLEIDINSFRLIDYAGNETSLPTSIYNSNTRLLETGEYTVGPKQRYTVQFKAKIIGQGDEIITNTMKASNDKKENAESSVDILVEEIPESLMIIKFLNEDGSSIYDPINLIGKVGSRIDLTKEKEILAAIQQIEETGYELVERPTNETNKEFLVENTQAVYRFKGKLLFEVPEVIDFGKRPFKPSEVDRVNEPVSITGKLAVRDTRSQKMNWDITAKLIEPLTNSTGGILPDGLRYVTALSDEKILDSTEQLIASGKNSSNDAIILSDNWSAKGEGLKLQSDRGTVPAAADYQAVIQWTLQITP